MSGTDELAALHARLYERRHHDTDALLDPELIPRAEASGDRDRLLEALALGTVGHFNRREWDEMEVCAKRAVDLFNSGPTTVDPLMIASITTCRAASADRPGSEARFYELAVEALEIGQRLKFPTLVALVNVGFAALALGDISLALHHLLNEEMPTARPELRTPEHPALSDLLGSLLASQGYWEQAIEPYRRILEHEHLPPSHELAALNTLALLGVLADDPELVAWASTEAERFAEEFGPERPELVLTAAAAALGRGEPATAVDLVRDLDVTAERASAGSDRLWLLALGHGRSGHLAEAIEALRGWLALDGKPAHRLGFVQSMFDLVLPHLDEGEHWQEALELATATTEVLASNRIDPLVSLQLLEIATETGEVDRFIEISAHQLRHSQAERRVDELTRSLRHDMRGSLQSLTLATTLLDDPDAPDSAVDTAFDAVGRATHRLRLSVDNARVLADGSSVGQPLTTTPCDPLALATDAIEEYASHRERVDRDQTVVWSGVMDGPATPIATDERLALLALRNLLLLPRLYADGGPAELTATALQLDRDRRGVRYVLDHGPHVRSEPGRVDLALDPRLSRRYARPTGDPAGLRPIEVLRLVATRLQGTFDLDIGTQRTIATLTIADLAPTTTGQSATPR